MKIRNFPLENGLDIPNIPIPMLVYHSVTGSFSLFSVRKKVCAIFAGRSSTFGGMLPRTWPQKMGHTVDGKTPAPLRMPEMLVLSQYQDVFGHPK